MNNLTRNDIIFDITIILQCDLTNKAIGEEIVVKIDAEMIKKINYLHKRALSTLFALNFTKYGRTVVFGGCWLCMVYSLNLIGDILRTIDIISLSKRLVISLVVVIGAPIVISFIYIPLIRIIYSMIKIKPLVESYEMNCITDNTYSKVKGLTVTEKALRDFKSKGLKRSYFIKIPLALICGVLTIISCKVKSPDEFVSLTERGWFLAVVYLFCTVGYYMCIAFTYWLTDTVILLPRASRKFLHELFNNYSEFEENWKVIKNNLKAEERRIREIEQKKHADKLYQQAIENDNTDYTLIKQAADLGQPLACLLMAKEILAELSTGIWAREEKEELAIEVLRYLAVPVKAQNVEAEFLWLQTRTQYESNKHSEWRNMLKKLRTLKNTDIIKNEYADAYDELIKKLVDLVDCTEE